MGTTGSLHGSSSGHEVVGDDGMDGTSKKRRAYQIGLSLEVDLLLWRIGRGARVYTVGRGRGCRLRGVYLAGAGRRPGR